MLSLFSFLSSDTKWEHTFLIRSLWYAAAWRATRFSQLRARTQAARTAWNPREEATLPPRLGEPALLLSGWGVRRSHGWGWGPGGRGAVGD